MEFANEDPSKLYSYVGLNRQPKYLPTIIEDGTNVVLTMRESKNYIKWKKLKKNKKSVKLRLENKKF